MPLEDGGRCRIDRLPARNQVAPATLSVSTATQSNNFPAPLHYCVRSICATQSRCSATASSSASDGCASSLPQRGQQMVISDVPFSTFSWKGQPEVTTKGESGEVRSRAVSIGDYRARVVTFSASYKADHWCRKGHIVFVQDGDLSISFDDGRKALLIAGEGFVLSDEDGSHLVESVEGATATILD